MDTLPYGRQTIEQDDIESVVRVLSSDYLTTGPEVALFERELAEYCGSRFAVVCSNGTAALHLACLALELKPKDEVITPALTFMATSNSVLYCGGSVAFVDIDPRTGCLDPKSVLAYLEKSKPRALFPVHYAGCPADMLSLQSLAKSKGLAVVEDACHAIGASYRDEKGEIVKVGSCRHSDMTVFSFHPVKQLTTGEGGAITTNSEELYRRLSMLRDHGICRTSDGWEAKEHSGPWYHEMQMLGFNYRLTDIQCALGRNQLKKLDRFVTKRRELANYYRTRWKMLDGLASPLFPDDVEGHSYHLFPIRIPFGSLGISRSDVMLRLREKGVLAQVHYIPVYQQPFYRRLPTVKVASSENTERYYEECLTLPLFPTMLPTDVDRVLGALYDALRR